MADAHLTRAPQPKGATGVVVFADGRTIWGQGVGAAGEAVGKVGGAPVAALGPDTLAKGAGAPAISLPYHVA